MAARLNVTEAERLSYSRRKLQAISALRNADLDPAGVMQGKEPLPTKSGRFYHLIDPAGQSRYCATLRQVIAYAQEYALYSTTMCQLADEERISWQRWLHDGDAYVLTLLVPRLRAIARQSPKEPGHTEQSAVKPLPVGALCCDPECFYPATGWIKEDPYCAGHLLVYKTIAVIREAKGGAA